MESSTTSAKTAARTAAAAKVLRTPGGHGAKVTNAELFFDLLYAFAVTQISHHLLADLTALGALQALLLWFAVWLGWQYTCWITNWFDPNALPIRLMLFVVMLLGLVMSAAIPQAFEGRGLLFALCYAAIQVGRTAFVLVHLGQGHALAPNIRRILAWMLVSAALWIAGGLVNGAGRLALWAVAIGCEYLSPMFGFRFPGLGRSTTRDWTIDGGHLAERCQLFVMLALGESVLVTGATIAGTAAWTAPVVVAGLVAFTASVAMWWIYFNTGSRDGTHAIEHADDPGRMGAWFHYVHVIVIGGLIVSAVASDLFIAHPDGHIEARYVAVLVGGPALYLLGNALYKRAVYGRLPLSHLAGLGALAVLAPLAWLTDLLMVGGLATAALLVVAVWETRSRGSANNA